MPPNQHALLSASSAHRWTHCTPSARLEQEFADRETEAAAEGTAAHALCEHKLRRVLKMRSKKPVSQYDSDEMDGFTDDYVQFVKEAIAEAKQYCKDPIVLIEQRLDFSCYVPEGFGTGDCLIVADKLLHIIDFKYGQGIVVESENNPQMMLYALGALRLFDHLYDIDTVSMTIFQPRRENISTWTIPVDALIEWAEKTLKPKAELAFSGKGEYAVGSWCQFCKAAVKCRARAEAKLELARYEFRLPPLLTDDEIEDILSKLDDLQKAINWWHRVPTANTATRKQSPKLLSRLATRIFTKNPSSPSPRWRSSWAKRHLPRSSAGTSQSRKANPRSSRHPISVRLSMLRVQKMILQ